LKKLSISGQGKIIYPGAGSGGSDVVVTGDNPYLLTEKAWMNDSINYQWNTSEANTGDIGCQMSAYRTFYQGTNTGPYKINGLGRRYEGTLHTTGFGQGSFTLGGNAGFSDPSILYALGTTAIARTIPTHPVAGAAVFLGELRNEGLPLVPAAHVIRDILKDGRINRELKDRGFKNIKSESRRAHYSSNELGGQYLNVEFGWKPIVADLRKFAYSIKNAHNLMDKLHRGSGQNVRRRYEFPTVQTRTDYTGSDNYYGQPAMANGLGRLDVWMMGSGPTIYREWSETKRKRWFSGCYTYYIPPATDFVGKAREYEAKANYILGTRLTPEVVWNISPWSWAADWFANLGDVARNYSAFGSDGLAMRYGYVMEENTTSFSASWGGRVNLVGAPDTYISLTESVGTKSMARRYSSPYGFGTTFDGLNPRQQAITVALGLTRTPRN
jgi:hypothetical protein